MVADGKRTGENIEGASGATVACRRKSGRRSRARMAACERVKRLAFRFLFWHTVSKCQSIGDIEVGQ
jgi:hypothetical protein